MNAQATPGFTERRKSDPLIEDTIDDSLIDEMRGVQDEGEQRRLKIMLAMNRNVWQVRSLVADVIAKIDSQDRAFERHRSELAEMMSAHKAEYEAHRKEFLQHAQNEEKIMAGGQFAWKVFSVIGLVVVSLGTYILNGHLADMRTIQDANATQEKALNTQDKDLAAIKHELRALGEAFSRHLITKEPSPANGLRLPER